MRIFNENRKLKFFTYQMGPLGAPADSGPFSLAFYCYSIVLNSGGYILLLEEVTYCYRLNKSSFLRALIILSEVVLIEWDFECSACGITECPSYFPQGPIFSCSHVKKSSSGASPWQREQWSSLDGKNKGKCGSSSMAVYRHKQKRFLL